MRLLPITQKITTELKKVESARKTVDTRSSRPTGSADKSEFSAGAQRLSETKANADVAAMRIANEPEIRQEKVDEVREKLKNGFYDSPEFMEKLVDKLMTEFGVGGQS